VLAVSVSSDNLIAELGDRQPGCGRGQRALQRKALLDRDRELNAHERTSPISASGLARGTSSCGSRRMRASSSTMASQTRRRAASRPSAAMMARTSIVPRSLASVAFWPRARSAKVGERRLGRSRAPCPDSSAQ